MKSFRVQLIVVLISVFCFACQSKKSPATHEMEALDLEELDKESSDFADSTLILLDTTLASGNTIFIYFNWQKDTLIGQFKSTAWDSTYFINGELAKDHSSINPLNEIEILWSTNEFAGMRAGCGAPCYYEVVFPFITGERPRRYFFPYTNSDSSCSLAENLIAYNSDSLTESGYPIINIKNLKTNKVDSIEIPKSWEPRVSMNAFFDTLYADNQMIFLGRFDSMRSISTSIYKRISLN
jgi:hypothetical protein